MSEHPRDKFEILDLVFLLLFGLCLILSAIILLPNFVVSSLIIVAFVLFLFVTTYYWKIRNPFSMYLIRSFGFTNFLFTFISFILFSYRVTVTLPRYFSGLILLLVPSGVYLMLAILFYRSSNPLDKNAGAALAFYGKIKNIDIALMGDSFEDKKRIKKAISQLKTVYRYKLIIVLTVLFPLISFIALIFGFL